MIVLTGTLMPADFEDGGQAAICELEVETSEGADPSFFIRLQSWNEITAARMPTMPQSMTKLELDELVKHMQHVALDCHPTIRDLQGKRVRITIESIDP